MNVVGPVGWLHVFSPSCVLTGWTSGCLRDDVRFTFVPELQRSLLSFLSLQSESESNVCLVKAL